MGDTSLGIQFSGLNCINYDMLKKWLLILELKQKNGEECKETKIGINGSKSFVFCLSFRVQLTIFLGFHS